MAVRGGLATLACAVLAACSSTSVPIPQDPIAALDLAESLLDRNQADAAEDVLDEIEDTPFANEDRARYSALRVRSLYATGEYWKSFREARSFVEEHRFSPLAAIVEEIEFRCGKTLVLADDGDGEFVLQHFVERFDASPHAAEALKLLGDFAFSERRYGVAQVRFTELLQTHPSSEWAAYARYRLAITAFRRVRGPEYDFDQMTLARNELNGYLSTEPERPEFRREAELALATLESWSAQRHVIIADFYKRIGNTFGERLHLERAVREFPGTATAGEARRRLAELGPAQPGGGS